MTTNAELLKSVNELQKIVSAHDELIKSMLNMIEEHTKIELENIKQNERTEKDILNLYN